MSENARLSDISKHLIIPDGITATGWPPVRDRAKRFALGFDRWQDGLGRCMLAKRADGLYASGIDGIQMSLPRQVGKTYLVGAIIFAMCSLQDGLFVLWTAHRTRTSDETFKYMQGLAKRPEIAPYVANVRAANGQQEILFKNGSRILFGAREGGFGRGFAGVDILVFDEAQILGQKALDDMVPAVNTAPNPLVIRLGTPPRPTDPSEAFTNFRSQALAGELADGLYCEIGADDDADPEDRKQWRKANPSYPHRTPESAILRMKRQLGPESFRREGLGIWDADATAQAIGRDAWDRLTVDSVPAGLRWCAAVRFSADGSMAALGAAGREPKRGVEMVYCELLTEQGVRPMGEGVQWIVDALMDQRSRWAQIVVDGKSGAGDMVDRLRAAGFGAKVIWTPNLDQVITAHAMMDRAIQDMTLGHPDDEELSDEAAAVTRRKIGALGGFGWQAPEGGTAAGIDAVTLAHWAAKTTKRRPRDGMQPTGIGVMMDV
ncbi:terminase [Actinomyces bowdenii]|uniref:terminase n=1 Tax=Actinomyces bowdenii TaxID=131109 RepID=UPI00214C5FBE|nr:terminase [Actinomyces bowdenii]MCR2051439.1 terminase [Actinomyces bowdenii]